MSGVLQSWFPLAVVAVLYAWQAVNYWYLGRVPMAGLFFTYSMGNLFYIWDMLRKMP